MSVSSLYLVHIEVRSTLSRLWHCILYQVFSSWSQLQLIFWLSSIHLSQKINAETNSFHWNGNSPLSDLVAPGSRIVGVTISWQRSLAVSLTLTLTSHSSLRSPWHFSVYWHSVSSSHTSAPLSAHSIPASPGVTIVTCHAILPQCFLFTQSSGEDRVSGGLMRQQLRMLMFIIPIAAWDSVDFTEE